jgi:diguanylate cyclase (GGDEF)-like protein
VGDQALVHVARTLAGALRPADLLARYGGEEFSVLLPDVTHADAMTLADRVRRAVEASSLETSAGTMPSPAITVSIGVATASAGEPRELQALIEQADALLVSAKRAGRNRVHG